MSIRKRFSGKQLRHLRKGKRLTLKAVAVALSLERGKMITPSTIGNWERDNTCPSLNDSIILAGILKCGIFQLCKGAR